MMFTKQRINITMILLGILLLREVDATCPINMEIKDVTVHMNEIISLPFSVNINSFKITSDEKIASISYAILNKNETFWNGILNITGVFLGNTKIMVSNKEEKIFDDCSDILMITVIRQERIIDTVFTASVAILVSILYINYGCAMDWEICRNTLKRPVGPAIGFFCQFVIMPLLSYFIGYFLFPEHPELQIGMFFTGISPSGGASNIWTVLLGGNLNLSVTMTTICTIAAFVMMPFWIFTLGAHIFERGNLVVPYQQIGMFVVGLIVPLGIGYIIQKKLPKLSLLLVRIMKPFSIILILFIVIFAIVTNVYLFKLFSLEIIIAGMGLPWLGFIFGLLISLIFKQPQADVKAIAIETGIQNTGVAIFLLRFTLKPPSDDLTTVVPVSSAIMTPIPLIILYIIMLISDRRKKSRFNNISEK